MRDVYERLVDVDEDHGCGDLPEEVCREVPGNAGRLIAALSLQKAGDTVVDAKTVLVWLLAVVGAPVYLTGLLVPVREAGSLLPQASMVPWVRRSAVRKRLWVLGAAGQAAAAFAMGLVAVTMTGALAGWAILGALAVFALARAVNSIASKDVMGRTVPKGQRGQVTGWATVASGLAGITVGLGLTVVTTAVRADVTVLGWLLAGGALAWVLAGMVFLTVREPAGDRDDAAAVGWLRHALRVLREDHAFRRFVGARTLLLVSALSPPFVVALAAREGGTDLWQLGPFVVATGIAMVVSGPVWGRLADRSSRQVMMLAAGTGSAVVVLLLAALRVEALRTFVWVYPLAYLLLAVAHTGARVGRKTYVVDLAEGNRRTDYVALSNTAMGGLLLLTGAISGALAELGIEVALAFLAALGAAGVLTARSLPEVTAPDEP